MSEAERVARAERHKAYYEAPFLPDNVAALDAHLRSARALEYIAAQLGRIASVMEQAHEKPATPPPTSSGSY